MKNLTLLFALSLCFGVFGQQSLQDINYDLIYYSSIQKYIHENIDPYADKITDIHPSCQSDTDFSGFQKQVKRYTIKREFSEVWDHYLNTNPAKSWEGRLVSFGVLLSKPTNSIIYKGGKFRSIEPGQIIFLNLNLLRGIYQLAMAFEIIKVDKPSKVIEFSYIEGNTSKGIQRLEFEETEEGHTQIVHTSFYKSHSKLRDKVLYPFYHKKATNEFHRNLRRIVTRAKRDKYSSTAMKD